MKQEIINFINQMNISYVALSILFLIASLLFLKKKNVNDIIAQMIIIILVSVAWLGFIYLNDILNTIFALSFLSVKSYLILLIIGNIIMLITINKRILLPYKITNYMMFITNIVIFTINVALIIDNKYNVLNLGTLEDATKLININFIVFIEYLNALLIIYIGKCLIDIISHQRKTKKYNKENNITESIDIETGIQDNQNIKVVYPIQKNDQEGFYIDGIDCSIIFEDEDKENIMTNYYILLNDVNAKLINGCTVGEYKKVKNIINKLNIKDLNNINLDINKLNKITIDEYNLLKRFLDNRNKSF